MSRRERVFGIWERFASFPRLVRCFYRAARSKFDRESVLDFYSDLESELLSIRDQLADESYRWGAYRSFWVQDPKLRRIESAPFRDRVVHHAMHEVFEPIFDPVLYDHSYACRSGRGTHAAIRRLRRWIGDRPDWFFVQMDVSRYFPSVDREILFRRIEAKIGDEKFLRLTRSLIFSAPGTEGIPIGNLTSQLFANLYLDRLDQFIKRALRVPLYIRYMDDIVLLAPSADALRSHKERVMEFARDELKLRFHPHKVSAGRARDGISFVGFRILPWRTAVRGRSLIRFRKRLRRAQSLDQKVRTLLSYRGHIRHADGAEALLRQLREIAFRGEAFMK